MMMMMMMRSEVRSAASTIGRYGGCSDRGSGTGTDALNGNDYSGVAIAAATLARTMDSSSTIAAEEI